MAAVARRQARAVSARSGRSAAAATNFVFSDGERTVPSRSARASCRAQLTQARPCQRLHRVQGQARHADRRRRTRVHQRSQDRPFRTLAVRERDLRQAHQPFSAISMTGLGKRETVAEFGHGVFPDGLDFDAERGVVDHQRLFQSADPHRVRPVNRKALVEDNNPDFRRGDRAWRSPTVSSPSAAIRRTCVFPKEESCIRRRASSSKS